jgi:valyl-tRNA synthetase
MSDTEHLEDSTKQAMDSRYSPKEIEEKWYSTWEDSGTFKPQGDGEPFSIVIPPPNVTGALHMGHALNNTLQDVLIRWKRLQGYKTLWQPGTDHAGIATQSVVERQLAKEGLSSRKLGREAFIEKVWEWKEEYGDRIVNQLRKLGCSCDWSRQRFTMDEGLSNAVRKVFVDYYKKDLIYKGTRLINWSPALQTALADEEVETKDTPGHFWSLRYPLEKDSSKHIVVSTTRPETMFGDTAVAVHPSDERYKDLIGSYVILPITGRKVPIIADEHADPEKGSGAVKITPAHDFNDYEVGQRNGLEQIVVMNPDATMNGEAGPYAGLNRFECRKKLIADLEEQGLIESIEDRVTPMPYCYRSGDVVEPRLMSQWFVKMEPLAKPAVNSVKEGRTQFVPSRYSKTYFDWLEQYRDWCISRQIWWGHRIPVWYAVSETNGKRTEQTPYFVCTTEEEAYSEAKAQFGDNVQLEQEDDVLDTWFSSGLWPFSTLGWPENTEDLNTFYPTDVLITGRDIIYFWVARMMFSGLTFLEKEPFHTVYIHGTILDEKGQRMSKSKGNGIDPLDMIDQYGTDAVRFSLLTLTSEGQDIKLSPTKFETGRNFANKLWNAVRFVLPHLAYSKPLEDISRDNLDEADKWILARLQTTIQTVQSTLEKYRFSDACQALYQFTWNDVCSSYLEIKKAAITSVATDSNKSNVAAVSTLRFVLRELVALLHPFMPFITEEIRSHLEGNSKELLITSSWPVVQKEFVDEKRVQNFEKALAMVEAVRSIRGAYSIPPAKELDIVVHLDTGESVSSVQENLLQNLEKIQSLKSQSKPGTPPFSASAIFPGGTAYVLLEGILDKEAEKEKLTKELEKARGFIVGIEKKLANKGFTDRAPEAVIQKEHDKLKTQTEKVAKLEANIASMEAMES